MSQQNAFREFEHQGWEQAAIRYHNFFSSLTTQAIPSLLNAVLQAADVTRKLRILDVATGPGYVAAAAAQRGASAMGVDFSAAMAGLASRQCPAVEFSVGDAEQLPFADRSFDAVVTNFGLLHLAHPELALAEAYRVLRPGGRVAFTVWAMPEDAVGFGIILRAIEAHGNLNVALPPGPPFFRFSNPQESSRALIEAGFRAPCTARVPQIWRLRSSGQLFEAMESATVRTRGLLRAQSREHLEVIRKAIENAARVYQKADGVELPMPALLASAVKGSDQ